MKRENVTPSGIGYTKIEQILKLSNTFTGTHNGLFCEMLEVMNPNRVHSTSFSPIGGYLVINFSLSLTKDEID